MNTNLILKLYKYKKKATFNYMKVAFLKLYFLTNYFLFKKSFTCDGSVIVSTKV